MQLRRRILKCLLAALAVAAVAGVLAVLLPTGDVMVKVMLTGLATAVAAGLMIVLTFMLSRPALRLGGLYGMCAVIADFGLCLVAIWIGRWLGSLSEEKLVLTIGLVALTTLPLLGYLNLVRREGTGVAGAVGAASAWGALGLFLVATWLPGYTWQHEEWWATAWTVGVYGFLVAACLLGAGPTARDLWRWAGALIGAIGAVTLVAMVWHGTRDTTFDTLGKVLCVLTGAAAVVGLANLSLRPRLGPGQRWVRVGTIAAAAATAIFSDVLVVGDEWVDEDLVGRLIAAAAIVTACGSLALLLLAELNRRAAFEPSLSGLGEMTIVCPACRTKQAVPIGASACRSCGLRMEITLEEPRCPKCEYLLFRLTSDRCPECGTAVRTARAEDADPESA